MMQSSCEHYISFTVASNIEFLYNLLRHKLKKEEKVILSWRKMFSNFLLANLDYFLTNLWDTKFLKLHLQATLSWVTKSFLIILVFSRLKCKQSAVLFPVWRWDSFGSWFSKLESWSKWPEVLALAYMENPLGYLNCKI